ncbi:hypothetical protein NHF50_06845 [Flavobacterium sp. NRK F10]|uniref:hypothetical protein n=1 Tax=Flavobacterium sp. NRK F10 TaxID=2954931 RepID=UPI002091BB0A|nr:hypothetical protein [Flavobacterium sp. NRK F10]MCO6174759.1 hypothetical protein [Flavobacterium sp. NRK F10]
METKSIIYSKLEAFIKKYYTNEIIKGTLLFVALGLLYFLFTLLVEHFLWLSTSGRTILFWLFIVVEVFLLAKFIILPFFKLFKLQKGIDYAEASKIIGNHFSDVGDKLLNFLQLSDAAQRSELLLASIDQKANALQPIPFSNAVDLSKNRKYLPYALIPIIVLLLFFITGNSSVIENSLSRVVHYETAYTPPAPFHFDILNKNLVVKQHDNFTLIVIAQGKVIPENVKIRIGNENYFMETVSPGKFQYNLDNVLHNVEFQLISNEVVSEQYVLQVVDVPTISNFSMKLIFPSYLDRASETVTGTGNIIVPEGTKINWDISAQATTEIDFVDNGKTFAFQLNEKVFSYSKVIKNPLEYQIVTSNAQLKAYEKLVYSIDVVKDQHPVINANFAPDSLKVNSQMIIGQVSDDYGLSKLQVVFYDKDDKEKLRKAILPLQKGLYDRFVYTFPSGLKLEPGISYEYYFEVFDNDIVNGNKSAKTNIFKHYELTSNEKDDILLKNQQENINALEKSLQDQEKQLEKMNDLERLNKEKSSLNFPDQKKIKDFIFKQQRQEEMMKEFSKKLEENIKDFKKEDSPENKELERRLDEFQKESEKNEKLLEELEKLTEKLQKEDLFKKADQLKQNAKNQQMSLEQLVELTKRYYAEEKAKQIAEKLDQLGDKQEELAKENQEKNTKEEQDKINQEFDQIKEELNQLEKENNELESPLDIPDTDSEEKDIDNDLDKASDQLQKKNTQKAQSSQKSAGQKMKEMSSQMMNSLDAGNSMQMQEDIRALRQILDNLLAFSFNQEDLLETTDHAQSSSLQFNKILKEQQNLKIQFKHIDDSIFAVAKRNPMISEVVLNEVGNVHYNLDHALSTLSENNFYKGKGHQQYTLTAANTLADLLSNIQSNMMMQMQMQMSGQGQGKPQPGKGSGGGMQLPDIIKQQQELGGKMEEGMGKGKEKGSEKGKESGNEGGSERGQGNSGQQNGDNGTSEGKAGEILEILKQQQQLRNALQQALEKEGNTVIGQSALDKMKDIEKQLLNKGFKNETLQKMLNLNHELLKLEKAIQQQGEDNKRKSNTNKEVYNGTSKALPDTVKDYLNSIEILNRQTLPLHPNYNKKVQNYFNQHD